VEADKPVDHVTVIIMIAIKDSADLPVEMMMRYTSYQMGINTGHLVWKNKSFNLRDSNQAISKRTGKKGER
jgi:hypothetical protein